MIIIFLVPKDTSNQINIICNHYFWPLCDDSFPDRTLQTLNYLCFNISYNAKSLVFSLLKDKILNISRTYFIQVSSYSLKLSSLIIKKKNAYRLNTLLRGCKDQPFLLVLHSLTQVTADVVHRCTLLCLDRKIYIKHGRVL